MMCEVSRDLRLSRMRAVFVPIQLQFFVVGLFFFFSAAGGHNQFLASTWGDFAYRFPATWWAGYGMAAAMITYRGLIIPMKHRLIIAGSAIHCAQFLAVAYSAAFTGGDVVIALYALVMFLPLHVWLIVEAVKYGAGR